MSTNPKNVKQTESSSPNHSLFMERILNCNKQEKYGEALKLLKEAYADRDQYPSDFSNWIVNQSKEIKKKHEALLENSKHLVHAAQAELKNYDYLQAFELLNSIPKSYRNEKIHDLLEDTREKETETRLLMQQLDDCIKSRDFSGMEENIERLVELKPNCKPAQRIWKAMQSYAHVPERNREYQIDSNGMLQRNSDENNIGKGVVLGLGLCVAVLCLGGAFAYIYFQEKQALLQIQQSHDTIKLAINGEEIIPREAPLSNKLDPGNKILEINYQGQTYKSSEFILKKGANPDLIITLEGTLLTASFAPDKIGSWEVKALADTVEAIAKNDATTEPAVPPVETIPKEMASATEPAKTPDPPVVEAAKPKVEDHPLVKTLADGKKQIDVLQLIDIKRDANKPIWNLKNNKLSVNTNDINTLIYVPIELDNEYTVDCSFEIKSIPKIPGSHGMGFRTPISKDRRVTVVYHDPYSQMLLNAVDGKPLQTPPYAKNIPRVQFALNKVHTTSYHVKFDDRNVEFDGSVNAVPSFEFKGEINRVQENGHDQLTNPYGKGLVITAWNTERIFHKISVTSNSIKVLVP